MGSTEQSPTVLSLCTGYGGLEIGLERVFGKVAVLAHVEIEAFAVANLVNKMETGKMVPVPIWTDVKTFDARPFRGCVDVLAGGYPCQPFSVAGQRKGADDPRHLWPHIRRIIDECRSGWVFLENVEGHLNKGVAEVLSDLEKMAYRPECGVFSAAEVGAPHQRKRVFILAHYDGGGFSEPGICAKQSRRTEIVGTSETSELWYSKSNKQWRLPITTMYRSWITDRRSSCNVADSERPRSQIAERCRETFKLTTSERSSVSQWPARPGEQQYEWEEPRTVVDTPCQLLNRRKIDAPTGLCGGIEEREKTKPELGSAVDGNIDRVDRLRLLGNGVVPQTAEKAFVTLYNKLFDLLQ